MSSLKPQLHCCRYSPQSHINHMLMGLAAWRLCWGSNDLVERECVFESVSNFLIIWRNELRLVFLFVATQFYALRLLSICFAYCHPWHFSNESFRSTYFFAAAKKSKQKRPLEGNALHPIILRIKQVVCTCSRQWQTQLASMLIALLNSQNNRRALSRG